MTSKTLTDAEMFALLPTISLNNDKPKTQIWLTQTDALKVMRDVEAEVLRRIKQDSALHFTVEKSQLPDACWNIVNPGSV
jgi:hypothetical protein